MKPKRTTAAEGQEVTPVRVVLLTLDNHVSAALDSAFLRLKRLVPGLQLAVHAAADWEARPDRLAACRDDIAEGDIIITLGQSNLRDGAAIREVDSSAGASSDESGGDEPPAAE